MDAQTVIDTLGLQPHPKEGGWFIETYRCTEPYGPRAGVVSEDLATAIYYLLSPTSISAMHRLPGDEIFHFYGGDPVHMVLLHPDGTHTSPVLGSDLAAGQRPQIVVPGGVWQGALLAPGGRWALLGTTMSPGFAFEDYAHGDIEALAKGWPEVAEAIRARALP